MSDQIAKEVAEMAKLTVLSNKINPIQEKNMKMFPLVYFEGVKQVKVTYDLSRVKPAHDEPEINNSLISYYIDLDESKNNQLDKRFLALETSLRDLFWKEIVVEVYFNDKIVYKGKRS